MAVYQRLLQEKEDRRKSALIKRYNCDFDENEAPCVSARDSVKNTT